MKFNLLFIAITITTTSYAQKPNIYKGKAGMSIIEFEHIPHPGSSTAKVTTGKKIDVYNFCSEDAAPRIQKLCWYSEKEGFNYKKNLKVNAPAKAKTLPKIISGTYNVNGVPLSFKLTRAS